MILKALRWLSRLDRAYFFAISALISATMISVALAVVPFVEAADGSDVSLLERDGALVLFLLVLPLLVLATPLIALPQNPAPIERSHKINAAAATFVLTAFVFVSLPSFGLFYGPALIFSVASTVSLFFGRNRGAKAAARAAGRSSGDDSDDSIRMSRSARRRMREEERVAAEGGEAPRETSPLASSRRRRGRRRKR